MGTCHKKELLNIFFCEFFITKPLLKYPKTDNTMTYTLLSKVLLDGDKGCKILFVYSHTPSCEGVSVV